MTITMNPADYFWLAVAGGIIIIVLIWLVVRRMKSAGAEDYIVDRVKQQWAGIEQLLEQNSDVSWKLAIMEADKLLDYALKSVGFPGKDLGERLRSAAYRHPQIRDVWPAHKARNRLVHETDYHLDARTARSALQQFKRALQTLRVL
ncbi:hypothetical protein HY933_03035 [Candidatus Falkowbacteria bacterium]|nr:hypothetical protein [Candidatus Falkowbacteria bacterium]